MALLNTKRRSLAGLFPMERKEGHTIHFFFPIGKDPRHHGILEEAQTEDFMSSATSAETGPAQVRLSEAIENRMREFSETRELAERRLVETDDGLELWDAARSERLEMAEKHEVRPNVIKDTGGGREIVELKPRTYTVREFAPGERGSKWGKYGVFDGDELLGMADVRPGAYDVEPTPQALSDFLRDPQGPAQTLLSESIQKCMREFGEPEAVAERRLVETEEGQRIWNAARRERMIYD